MRDEDSDETVAQRLGLPLSEVHERLGAGWRSADSNDVIDDDHRREWFVAGDPPQLMLGVADVHDVVLAVPRGRWNGPGHLEYAPERPSLVDVFEPGWVNEVRADLLRRRRAGFRYCVFCLDHTAPEHRSGDTCHSCLTAVHGAVF